MARFIDCRSRFKNNWKNPGNNFKNTGLTLVLALSYGRARRLWTRSRAIAEKVQSGDLVPEEVTETLFGMHLYTSQIPIRIF